MPRALFVLGWMAATAFAVTTTYSATEPRLGSSYTRSGEVVVEVDSPVLVLPEPEGSLLLGERSTGRIRRVDEEGSIAEDPVATLEVTSGSVGLLGLAHDAEGRLFASWIGTDQRLVVGRVGGRRPDIVWRGPRTGGPEVGGRLALMPDGRLLVAVGGAPEEGEEPTGRLLSLDPDGRPRQDPKVLASGLTHPTAIVVDESGVVWVADDESPEEPQPLLGVSSEGDLATVASFPEGTALDLTLMGDSMYACTSTGLLLRYRLEDLDGDAEGDPVVSDCALGVAPLEDGRLVYSSEASVRTIRP